MLDHLAELGASFEVVEIDPALADTAAFCAEYGYALEASANAILVASRRPPGRLALCLVLATTRLDVNNTVRRLLDVRKLSFAPAELTADVTGMEIWRRHAVRPSRRRADLCGRSRHGIAQGHRRWREQGNQDPGWIPRCSPAWARKSPRALPAESHSSDGSAPYAPRRDGLFGHGRLRPTPPGPPFMAHASPRHDRGHHRRALDRVQRAAEAPWPARVVADLTVSLHCARARGGLSCPPRVASRAGDGD